jgi:hypothetical protein
MLNSSRTRSLMRQVKLLVGSYLTLSGLTVVAVFLMRNHPNLVTIAVWIRTVIVTATAALMAAFATGTARGSRRAYLRLRLASAIMVIAIAAIVALPDGFPLWMKVEQNVCGLLLIGVTVLVNGRHMRTLFSQPSSSF